MATHLAWTGLINARDLVGTPTADGSRRIRPGALMRAESPHPLDAVGWQVVADHGVRTAIDLRSGFERAAGPYGSAAAIAGIEVVVPAFEDGLLEDPEFLDWAQTGVLGCALYYPRFLERWPDRTAAAVRAAARARPGGLLLHCVGGRDRTGLLTALLLRVAGVGVDRVVDDYLLTDERYAAAGEWFGDGRVEVEARLYAERATTARAFVTDLLAELDVERYLRGAGVDAADLDAIRARLLEAA